MTTKITHFQRFRALYAIGLIAAVVLLIARWVTPAQQFEWPAWVQAVGSIAAILAAVWVGSDQIEQQLRRDLARDEAETEGVLRSLKAEVETSLHYMEREVEPALARIAPGNPITFLFRLPEHPFPIFDSLIPKIALIRNTKLHRKIIHTYAAAKSLTLTTNTHNDLMEELEKVEVRYRSKPPLASQVEYAGALRAATEYSATLRSAYDETLREVRQLLETLSSVCPDQD